MRAINYKLGKNTDGQLIPMPQFTDNQSVEVHTILKSSNGVYKAQTLTWRYDLKTNKLILKKDTHSISIPGFNNDAGVKWYISGIIGGTLAPGTTQVSFKGTRVLQGTEGNEGDIIEGLDVPYTFGWTELSIDTKSSKDNNGSYLYAYIKEGSQIKFSPRGALIAYKLGNALISGPYTFTPTGFTVGSNAWGDQGTFELNTSIPTSNPSTVMPTWIESPTESSMYYTFATGYAPGDIAHGSKASRTYYAWVMPYATQPTKAEARVMLKGSSSLPETLTYKDHTKVYFTDYTPKASGSQGKVSSGKVHQLAANATYRLVLPIEYVTEYNLAGGPGLTATIRPPIGFGLTEMAGTVGPLRFANSHRNDQSGYYNWYKAVGRYDQTLNPSSLDLNEATLIDSDKTSIKLKDKYRLPDVDQWWGVFPTPLIYNMRWAQTTGVASVDEMMGTKQGGQILRNSYLCSYSKGFTSPLGSSPASNNAILYAIRFKARPPKKEVVRFSWDYNLDTQAHNQVHLYPSALDNSLKCAYRFTRVGGAGPWEDITGNKPSYLEHRLIVDVVYLGEELSPTSLATISEESWWAKKKKDGAVLSRTFPAAGDVHDIDPQTNEGIINKMSYWGYYHSASWERAVSVRPDAMGNTDPASGTISVRLFHNEVR